MEADAVVVGLGLVGAAALRHLAGAGVAVVGVGPAEPPSLADHRGAFASHYDSGRITRLLDARFEWAELARRSIAAYPAIAAAGGPSFHEPVGAAFASASAAYVDALVAVGERVGAQATVLAPGTPLAGGRLAVPTGSTVVTEPGPAGFIDPRRMLAAQLAAAAGAGARVVRAEVVACEPDGAGGWRVRAADGTEVRTPRVLVAAGAHTDELAASAAFASRVRPEAVVLATLDAEEAARLAGIPSVLAHLPDSSFVDLYQVPPTAYPDGTVRLKLGATLRSWAPLATGAERRAWMAGRQHETWLPELRSLVEALVPGLRATAWETKPCLITDTPSGLPTVDHLAPGLVLAAGGNGFAAKSADAIGALAARLLLDGTWSDPVLDPADFRLGAPPPPPTTVTHH